MKRVHRGEFWPGLEEALVAEVSRARTADPLRPIDLLIGSNLLGLYLRRLLARRLGAVAGVRPLTFLDLARRRVETVLLADGRRPLPPLGEDLVIARVVSGLSANGYFEPVKSFPGFRTALLGSIRDLKDAGWSPADLREGIGRGRFTTQERMKLLHLLRAFEDYEEALRVAKLYDRSDLLREAYASAFDAGDPGSPAGGDAADLRETVAESADGPSPSSVPAHGEPDLFGRSRAERSSDDVAASPGPEQLSLFDAHDGEARDPSVKSGSHGSLGAISGVANGAVAGHESSGRTDSSLLLAYGFYDLLDVQWRLLAAEARHRDTVAFVPSGRGEPLAFAVPLLRKLEAEGFVLCDPAVAAGPHIEDRSSITMATRASSGDTAPDAGCDPPAGDSSRGIQSDEILRESHARARRSLSPAGASVPLEKRVEVLSALGESRQAVEITRQVLAWAGEGLRFGEMAVLARSAEPTLTEAARALDRAGVPVVPGAGRPFAATRVARTALQFLSIPSSDWGREEVIGFLTLADLKPLTKEPGHAGGSAEVGADEAFALPGLAADEPREIAPAEWDLLSAEMGLVKGREAWHRALRAASARAYAALQEIVTGTRSRSAPDREDDEGEGALSAVEVARWRLARARSLEQVILRVGHALDLWPPSGAWSVCGPEFHRTLASLLRPSPELEELELVLEGFGGLDPLGPCPDREAFADVLRRAFSRRAILDRRFERDGVFVSTIEAARGLSFRAVVVAGMAEKIIPADVREDPLLLDSERERLGRGALGRVSLSRKANRLEEERLLFHLAAASARERLLLTWSRINDGEDRECFPSPFLRDAAGPLGATIDPAVQRGDGDGPMVRPEETMETLPFEGLGDAAARQDARAAAHVSPQERQELMGGPVRLLPLTRVPLLPLAHADSRLAVDTAEWLLSRAAAESRDLPSAHSEGWRERLSRNHPFLAKGLASERARFETRTFGPHDGYLSAEAGRRAFERFLSGSVSPTRIDDYASCPFKVFLGRVLGIRALRDPVEAESIEPRDRGTLVHLILAGFLRELVEPLEGRVRLRLSDRDSLRRRLGEVADREFDRAERRFPVGYPLLWAIEKARILEWLHTWLDGEIEAGAESAHAPALFEWSFGSTDDPESGPSVEIPLPSGRLVLHGKLDRIDIDDAGSTARVIDYKTSARPLSGKAILRRIQEGRGTQLPVYRMAALRALGRDRPPVDVISAEFKYLADGSTARLDQDAWTKAEPGFLRTLETLVSSARSGDFTADPREEGYCGFCDFQMPCGRSRTHLFERKRGDARVEARLDLRNPEPAS